MGFAASNLPISYSTIPGDSISLILSGLHTILVSVGWASTVIVGGHQYVIANPTATLGAKVRVYDGGSHVIVQFLSLNELRIGQAHKLSASSGKEFQVWANCCQLFISVAGVTIPDISTGNCSVAGGIPYVPPSLLGACGISIGPELATEIWWSNGDGNLFDTTNFRYSIAPGMWSACYNGDLIGISGLDHPISQLRLLPKAITLPWGPFFGTVPRTRYRGGEQLFFEPIVGWGDSTLDSPTKWRGQLWDSVQGSIFTPVDDLLTNQGFDFINYMGDMSVDLTRFSSLYLMVQSHSVGSFGYIY